jgi:hypothetical protein
MKITRDDEAEGRVHWIIVKLDEDQYAVDCPAYSADSIRKLIDAGEAFKPGDIEWGEPSWPRLTTGTLDECVDFIKFIGGGWKDAEYEEWEEGDQ